MQEISLYKTWIQSITPSKEDIASVAEGKHPYGEPSKHVGFISDTDNYERLMRGDDIPSPASDTKIKKPGSPEANLPDGYKHLQEVVDAIVDDQEQNNPFFKHASMLFTYRQTLMDRSPERTVHIDPARTNNSVADDQIYFISNKEGTMTQAAYVKKPEDTLNRMKPEVIMEEGLLNQAEPFELRKGTQDTYHVQGADTYTNGRTFVRMIISHPDISYFHDLSDEDKAELPEKFRTEHGIVIGEDPPSLG